MQVLRGKRNLTIRLYSQGQIIKLRSVEITRENPDVTSNFILFDDAVLKTRDKKVFTVKEQT